MDSSINRKRTREEHLTYDGKRICSGDSISLDILAHELLDPGSRVHALNKLMKTTANHETNYSLESDRVLASLTRVFFDTIGWDNFIIEDRPVFEPRKAWIGHTIKKSEKWECFCKHKLKRGNLSRDQSKCLEAVLVIIRNLSFVAANLRLLAYSSDIIFILVGCLYESSPGSSVGESDDAGPAVCSIGFLSSPALHILVNLAPYLDVTGQKLLCDKMFLSSSSVDDIPLVPSPSTFGQLADGRWGFGGLWLAKRLDAKEDVVQNVSKDMLLQLTENHIICTWAIFPGLAAVLTDPVAPRHVVMTAIELLQEFINQARIGIVGAAGLQDLDVPNARSIVVNVPDDVLRRLTDLLYIPRLGPDALEYINPLHNIVTRVTTLKLLMGYDATVDTDIRDRTLDVLVPLLELDSPNLAKRLGVKKNGAPRNRLYDAILPIMASQAGRNEAPLLATQLLREISKAKENRQGCQYLQQRILSLASKDTRLSHLAFNYLTSRDET